MSNFSIEQLEDLRARSDGDDADAPAVLQCEMHPHLQRDDLLAYCAARGIAFQAYAPLGGPRARGALLERSATVRAIAAKHGRTPAQVLLRWGAQRGAALVTSSADAARIAEAARAWEFGLDADDMARLRGLDAGTHYYWDGGAVP